MKKIILASLLLISANAYSQTTGEGLVINEFMASNDSTAMDPAGDFDDWIELFNMSDDTIDLSGFFLSDKEDNPSKFEIPDSLNITIAPQAYVIVWADEDGDKMQEGIHANFKLSGGGEAVVLSNPDTTIIDQVVYGEQVTDLSYARTPNGTGDFEISNPTFGVENDITSPSDDIIIEVSQVNIFPNPTDGQFELTISGPQQRTNQLSIFNVLGKRVGHYTGLPKRSTIDISNQRTGIYLLVVNDRYPRKIILK